MRPPHGHHRADFPLALADIQATAGGGNAFRHNREPAQIEEQTVIRLNRDTFYSFAVVDLAGGGRLAIPDPGDRYVSVMVVNEDHLINEICHGAGTFELSTERTNSRYALVAVRTLVDPDDPTTSRRWVPCRTSTSWTWPRPSRSACPRMTR